MTQLNQNDILNALDTRLQSFATSIDVAWDDYEPKIGTPYLARRLSSCQRRTIGAGIDGQAQYDGTYTVIVRRPAEEGNNPAGQTAAALVAYFARGAVVATADGVPVILVDATEQPPYPTTPWINVPVVVQFVAGGA